MDVISLSPLDLGLAAALVVALAGLSHLLRIFEKGEAVIGSSFGTFDNHNARVGGIVHEFGLDETSAAAIKPADKLFEVSAVEIEFDLLIANLKSVSTGFDAELGIEGTGTKCIVSCYLLNGNFIYTLRCISIGGGRQKFRC